MRKMPGHAFLALWTAFSALVFSFGFIAGVFVTIQFLMMAVVFRS